METINVAVRVRPSLNVLEESTALTVISEEPPVLFLKHRQQHFTFDHVFVESSKQTEVYEKLVRPLLQKVLDGYNGTVFAYGQTGTGKTYTIGSDPEAYEDSGFIVRTLEEIFDYQEEFGEVSISISFFEIYNEKVYDLLGSSKNALPVKNFKVQGLTQAFVASLREARNLIRLGSVNRHKGKTKQNLNSSRSHAIFSIQCSVKHENYETEAKLNLVDLAGSESARKTGCEGSQFEEGVNINKGLLHVGMVINALSANKAHIPYRQSILTTILQDSLDKKTYITFVACVSPDVQDMNETFQTLLFAQRTKQLKNKPEVNQIVQQYKKTNPTFFPGSAVKVQQTPLKRPRTTDLLQYTAFKKPKINSTWTPGGTNEPRNGLSPKSTTSMNFSSISSISDLVPMFPSLSPIINPVVQKCTEALEATILEKLQVLMTSRRNTPVKSATPKLSIQELQSEVAQMVKKEMIPYSSKASRACSSPISPIEFSDSKIVAKRLEFSDICLEDQTIVFKVPTALPRKNLKVKKNLTDSLVVATELDAEPSTSGTSFAPRRSARLSMKKQPSPVVPASPLKRRQSRRLSMKKQESALQAKQRKKVIPTPAPRRNIKQFEASHIQYILNILNTGTQKELQKLPAVGPKTASQIFFYRQLHGEFSSISDVGKMESWRGSAYQRFLQANFLKLHHDK